ncbi:MAG TPA: hypothetical protein VJ846_07650 [Sphingomicrobium sp.]|nr:hypothetical protein [Sphingomicrobium sp.]
MHLYSGGVYRNASSNFLNLLPLGIPTLIIADDPQLIAAAGAAYAHWSVEAPHSEPRIKLRLEIGNASPTADVSFDIRVEGSRLQLKGRGADGTADAAELKARATITRALANDLARFTEIVDTLLLFLLARDGRTPVHASGFMLGNLAILLAGPSGSGKSTLALAAANRGLGILSDDMVFVQREPSFAIWGFPRPMHLFLKDAPPGEHPRRWRNEKLKVAVPLEFPALKAERSNLVLLNQGKALEIREISATHAIEQLMRLDAGFDLLENDSRVVLQTLVSAGAWQLTLTHDADAAIELIVSRFGT